MPETLAQKVRAKYPGVYNHLSDADLEQRVRAKYPGVYDHLPQSSAAPDAPMPSHRATPATPAPREDSLLRGLAEGAGIPASWDEAKALAQILATGPFGLNTFAKGLVEAGAQQFQQGQEARRAGRTPEAWAHYAATLAPGIGPFVMDTTEMFTTEPARATGRTISAALTGGLLQSGRRLANPARAKTLTQEAKTLVTQALDPRKERWKADTARIAEEVARRGVKGNRQQVLEQAQRGMDKVGGKIDEFWEPRGDTLLPTSDMVAELEKSKFAYQNVVKDPQTGAPLKVLDTEPEAVAALTKLQEMIEEYGDTISAQNARSLMNQWREPVGVAGGYSHRTPSAGFGTDLKTATDLWAKREGGDAIHQVLVEAHPDIQQLNREYTFQRRLRDITQATERRVAGHRSVGLGARAAQAGGSAAGATVGASAGGPFGSAIGAVVGGEAAKRLAMVFDGPRWKLFSARRKQALADAIASGDAGRIRTAVGKAIAFDQSLMTGVRGPEE